ncbi:hypothetical protein D3C80_1466510 [compost metagenome]
MVILEQTDKSQLSVLLLVKYYNKQDGVLSGLEKTTTYRNKMFLLVDPKHNGQPKWALTVITDS